MHRRRKSPPVKSFGFFSVFRKVRHSRRIGVWCAMVFRVDFQKHHQIRRLSTRCERALTYVFRGCTKYDTCRSNRQFLRVEF